MVLAICGKMFRTNKILNRLNTMLDKAISGEDIESNFDESKASQIESKLHKYLMQTGSHKAKITEQKLKIDELISDISHQTKTPLASISLYSELLLECINEEEYAKYNALLKSQTEKLTFLITSLVKTSRLENGIISVQPKVQSASLLYIAIKEAFPSVHVIESEISLCYDLKWTSEAVFNIIDNAIKYESTDTKISMSAYEMFVRIDISDNGIGISEDEIPKIFARFYRSESSYEKDGVGIGLYLAREIISKQNGYIKVKSKLGEGSVFSVFLPKE